MSRRGPGPIDRLRAAVRRARALVLRSTADRDMSRELAFHLDMETEHNIRRGMDPESARRAARIAFGGVDRFAEDVRDTRNIGWLEDFIQDLRHALRGFRRAPGFTATAVVALSLGIGANTAVYSVVHAVVLAPLPYAEPDRLVRVWENNPSQRIERSAMAPGTFADLRERSKTIDEIALLGVRTMLVTNAGETFEGRAAAVSPAFFEMLGMRPVAGRTFPPEGVRPEWGGSFDEVIISHRLWQQHFGGRPDVVGRTIRLEYRWTYTIVGVMQPGFTFPEGAELWTPLAYGRALSPTQRQYRYYDAVARLRPGVTVEQARQDAAAIAATLESEHPASNAGWSVTMEPLDRAILGTTRLTLLILLGLAACVLCIACGNVATLAVARATSRRHEAAVRLALGAGRRRLLRQWAAEGLLLAALGGAGGLALAYWSSRLLIAIAPNDIPRLGEVAFGVPSVVFLLLTICIAGVLVGLAPALRSSDSSALDAMRSRTGPAGVGGQRTREWLVGAQVALTFVLAVAAALLLRSFERLRSTDLGFRHHDIVSAELRVPGGRFAGPHPWFARLEYYDRLIADLTRIPGVRSVAGITTIPLTAELASGSMWRSDAPGAHGVQPPASAGDQWRAAIQIVTPEYFATMGIPVVRGRPFEAGDRFTPPQSPNAPLPPGVAIVNEAMAKRFWPNGEALGTRIFIFDDKSFAAFRTVVAVVRDVRAESFDAPAVPTVFLPFGQHPGRGLSLLVRSDLPPALLVGSVNERLRAFDAATTGSGVQPLDAVVGGALSRPRFTMLLAGSFAALALVIAAIGVFGVVGFLVARRTQEIGIRMALGARPRSMLWLVLGEGLRPVLLGIAVGSVGAVAVARGMRAILYGLAPIDGVSFAAAALVLVTASGIAAIRPASRAVGVDPLRSLRDS